MISLYQDQFYYEDRNRIIIRQGGMCEDCGVRPIMNVHHKRYASSLPLDKVGLCAYCHEDRHRPWPLRCGCNGVESQLALAL